MKRWIRHKVLRPWVVCDVPSFYERVLERLPVSGMSDVWIAAVPFSGVRKTIYNERLKRILEAGSIQLHWPAWPSVPSSATSSTTYRSRQARSDNSPLFTLSPTR